MADERRTTRFEPVTGPPEPRRPVRDSYREAPPETAVLREPPPRRRPVAPPDPSRRFAAATLWAGSVATALVTGLLAIVGILVARGLLGVDVLAPKGDGVWGNANTLTYALTSAACALGATALLQLLLATTPNAIRFFSWIMVLLTAIAVVLPLSLSVSPEAKAFTAVLNLVIGVVIVLLLRGVVGSARRKWAESGR
ncbi:DUF6069 family protein [Saccharothrix sp. MB29]|nr:DUF6069 family protein [Saccharothrix sp. MB29]